MEPERSEPRTVSGVDGWKDRWVAVELRAGAFARAFVVTRLADLRSVPAEWIAVDVPIGLERDGPRAADVAGKRLLGAKSSTLFMTPPRPVLDEPDFVSALAKARELSGGVGISRQTYALFRKILEAEAAKAADPRIIEVHPELSFRVLAGHLMAHPKRSWNGILERRRALAGAGIELPEALDGPAGLVPPDDVLDAAVAAWSADRMARGEATPIPEEPSVPAGSPGRIWT
jgi:predicted RNase H-like nuclease